MYFLSGRLLANVTPALPLDACLSNGPRYGVDHNLVSIFFTRITTSNAKGCRRDNAFMGPRQVTIGS